MASLALQPAHVASSVHNMAFWSTKAAISLKRVKIETSYYEPEGL